METQLIKDQFHHFLGYATSLLSHASVLHMRSSQPLLQDSNDGCGRGCLFHLATLEVEYRALCHRTREAAHQGWISTGSLTDSSQTLTNFC